MPREAPLPRGERTQEPLEWGDARKFPLLDDEGPGYYRLFLVREGRSDLFLSEGIFPAAGSGERALLFDVPAILGPCQLRLECRAPDGVVTSGLVGKYTIAAPLAPSAAPPDDWHDAALEPGWHPWLEGGNSHPGYFRDALGIVHLRGVAVFARPPTGSYEVWLTDLGERKAEVIAIVRAVNPALNLEVVLQFDGRAMIAGDLSLSAAEELAERLAAAGARVLILPHHNLAPAPAPP